MARSRFTNTDNWSEFEWEEEIRRDERRISCYYRELPGCLDLPGEEEMIYNSLLSHPGLVPIAQNTDPLHFRDGENEADDEDDEEQDKTPPPPSELIDRIDRLAAGWNAAAARIVDDPLMPPFLAVACEYGKLLGRAADAEAADAKVEPGLKRCLAKRAVFDLNNLAGMLRSVAEVLPELAPEIETELEGLQLVREQLCDLLASVKPGC